MKIIKNFKKKLEKKNILSKIFHTLTKILEILQKIIEIHFCYVLNSLRELKKKSFQEYYSKYFVVFEKKNVKIRQFCIHRCFM